MFYQRTAAFAGRIAIAILLAGCGGKKPQVISVDIKQMAFTPATVNAHVGDTLVVTNHDFVPHTATARDGSWDTGSIAPDSTRRVAITKAGPFYCTFHPNMSGKVVMD